MNELKLDKIKQESVTDKVAAALRSRALSGDLGPGTRLIESHLARQFDVSRAPVRDAFRILEREGLVVTKPGAGTYVAEISDDDLREIYTLRAVLEGLAMRLVAEHVTESDCALLAQIVERMKEAEASCDADLVVESDLAFHQQIWKLSGHRRLNELLSNMLGPIRMFLALNTTVRDDLMGDASEHMEILTALSSGSAERSEEVMMNHIQSTGNELIDVLKSAKGVHGETND